jgi:tRNA(Ile)-lysidine synthase
VSGGPDSLCLLDALARANIPVIAAHFNHHLRPESDADAHFVQQQAAKYRVPLVYGEAAVAAIAAQRRLSTEEAAREARYTFLFAQAALHQAQSVVTAHNADDQVETMLMHLLRGAGLAGLRGMSAYALPNPWSHTIALARPLLGVWRSQILQYCEQNHLTPVFDQTNADTTLFRNRLRHELIPLLETYNPRARQHLWQTAQLLAQDYSLISHQTRQAWEACCLAQTPSQINLHAERLQNLPRPLQHYVLRHAIELLRPGLRDIDFETIARGADFVMHPPRTRQCDWKAGLRLVWEADSIWVMDADSALPKGAWPQIEAGSHTLPIPGELAIGNGWRLRAEIAPPPADAAQNVDPFQAWISLPGESTLLVRSRTPGDRFQPLGFDTHSMKLSDFMINLKLPRRARECWPLVCAGDRIVWVAGYRVAQCAAVLPGAPWALHLTLSEA